MSQIALARKWRPRTFSQLVGQEYINKALINSLNLQRLHHAYLFTGTRGVGKTSIARLLAKALNCEQGISAEPCLQCEACLAIEQGRFMDLIEIDAASKTRVEDTRDILENVQYAPAHGRFKVYLIDEVHMLSNHSFNALLKTLEEPPSHVKFILATTDPQKLPVTILSRCLQFHLKPIALETIAQHLQKILLAEQISYEPESLTLLAKSAQGSMRDALSLLDQAIALKQEDLKLSDVKNILGYTQKDYAIELLQSLANRDPQRLISISRQIAAEGAQFQYVLEEILSYLHQISLAHLQLKKADVNEYALELSQLISAEDTQLFYEIGIKSLESISLAPTLAIGFEMALLRMYAFRPASLTPMPSFSCHTEREQDAASLPVVNPIKTVTNNETVCSPPQDVLTSISSENWTETIKHLKLSGLALSALEHCEFIAKESNEIKLSVASGHASVFTAAVIKRIEEAFSKHYQEKVRLNLCNTENTVTSPAQQKKAAQEQQLQAAHSALEEDVFFQQLKETFSAEIIKNSIISKPDEL